MGTNQSHVMSCMLLCAHPTKALEGTPSVTLSEVPDKADVGPHAFALVRVLDEVVVEVAVDCQRVRCTFHEARPRALASK